MRPDTPPSGEPVDLRLVRAFVLVADTGSITVAAQILG